MGDKERKREGEEGELEQRTTGDEKGKKKERCRDQDFDLKKLSKFGR